MEGKQIWGRSKSRELFSLVNKDGHVVKTGKMIGYQRSEVNIEHSKC